MRISGCHTFSTLRLEDVAQHIKPFRNPAKSMSQLKTFLSGSGLVTLKYWIPKFFITATDFGDFYVRRIFLRRIFLHDNY